MYVCYLLNKICIWTNIWPEKCWCGFRQGACGCPRVQVVSQCPFLEVSDQDPALEASPSRHTWWPRAVWPGGALCSCLAVNSSRGQQTLLQCSVPYEPKLLWHLSPCCHWPQVCLFVTPAVPRAAWAHGVIDLFTRCFPCGHPVAVRIFIFCCGRWQRGCVCVCASPGDWVTALPPPGASGTSPFPVGWDASPSLQDIVPACTLVLLFLTEKPERWWQQDQLSLLPKPVKSKIHLTTSVLFSLLAQPLLSLWQSPAQSFSAQLGGGVVVSSLVYDPFIFIILRYLRVCGVQHTGPAT